MDGYVVIREDGRYVARPGSEHSYTRRLQNARVYDTRPEADRDCCSNERVVSVYAVLSGA
jgi:hypothetical protein